MSYYVEPCIYTPDHKARPIPLKEGEPLKPKHLRDAINAPYALVPLGDNIMAITTGGVRGELNIIASELLNAEVYGSVVVGHRSFFTGGV